MRFIPWRGAQPKHPASAADQAQLHERLARLTGGPAPTEAISPPAKPVAEPILVAAPVPHALTDEAPAALTISPYVAATSGEGKDRPRRRRLGFLLFFAGLILVFFVVRAIPADWEIGPFKIDASGSAADAEASLYFADNPHAPFWRLVPTFNFPPRSFRPRPTTSPPAVALAPLHSPTPSASAASPTATPSSSASTSPSATPSGSASPSASPSA